MKTLLMNLGYGSVFVLLLFVMVAMMSWLDRTMLERLGPMPTPLVIVNGLIWLFIIGALLRG